MMAARVAGGGQTQVPRSDRIVAVLFEPIQKTKNPIRVQSAEGQGRRFDARDAVDESKQQPEGIPIARNGLWAETPLAGQIIGKEALE
jgi:hypothetical protein